MKITLKMKSKLFRMAHSIKSQFDNFALALAHAWRVIKLQAMMMVRNVKFQYRKVNGEIREAVGTLNFTYESKGTGKSSPSDSMVYMEEGKGIRSCKLVNII